MSAAVRGTLVLLCLAALATGCEIELSVRSNTDTPFQFEVIIPTLRKQTERATLLRRLQQKKVKVGGPKRRSRWQIVGSDCLSKPWLFRTYKQEAGQWQLAQEHPAKLDGKGRVLAVVDDKLMIQLPDRLGVFCSETILCGRGRK